MKQKLWKAFLKLAAEMPLYFKIVTEGSREWQALLKALEEFLEVTKGSQTLKTEELPKLEQVVKKHKWIVSPRYKPRREYIFDIKPGLPDTEGIVLSKAPAKRWYVTETTDKIVKQPANLGAVQDVVEEIRDLARKGIEHADVFHGKSQYYFRDKQTKEKAIKFINQALSELTDEDLYRPTHNIKIVEPKTTKWKPSISLALKGEKMPEEFVKKPHFIRLFLTKQGPKVQSFHYLGSKGKESTYARAVDLLLDFQRKLREGKLHKARYITERLARAFVQLLDDWKTLLK